MTKKIPAVIIMVAFIMQHTLAQTLPYLQPQQSVLRTINKNMLFAGTQYKFMAKQLSPGQFPKSYNPITGKFETSNAGWWCSGFYPGSLLLLYKQNHDAQLLKEAENMLAALAVQQYNTGTHDLGFMMYTSFGNAQKIVPKPAYRQILINSAKSLATRFNPTVGCIKIVGCETVRFFGDHR